MKVTTTLTGDLEKNLRNLPNAVSRTVEIQALKKGAEPIRSAAASLAPRGDHAGPHLADNIIIAVPSETRLADVGVFDTSAVEVGPRKSFFWGYFQEFGTAFQPAKPFLRPAFDTHVRRSLTIIGAEAWQAIRTRLGLGGGSSSTRGHL